jgi:sugar phosphate isomerase/epimerase
MILGNAAWGFRETPLEKQLKITEAMGLSLLELSMGNSSADSLRLDASNEEMKKVREMFKQHGVDLLCGSTGNDFTGEDAESCREDAKNVCKAIDVAAEMGIKYLRIFAGFSPVDEVVGCRWNTMIECINIVAEHAREKEVALSIETHGGVEKKSETECRHFHSTSTEEKALEKLLEEIPKDVGINFDPANLNAVGYEKPEEVYRKISDRVNYIHLKDFAPIEGSEYLTPAACGEGPVDWKSLMDALKSYDGPALIEYENTSDAEDGFKRSLEFLKKFL